jgi:protein gp37
MVQTGGFAVMADTSIEWTDTVWNPVRGCVKVSPGCKNCYAEAFAERFRGVAGHPYEQGFDPRIVQEKLEEPLGWKRPRMVFVNSMSDLFQEYVPDWFISNCFSVMEGSRRHTYQVLTKRPERMADWVIKFDEWLQYAGDTTFAKKLPNVWLGVSVEDRKYGLPRIEHLRRTPSAIRFLSCEPLLEDLGQIDLTGIHWVIVGGESGRGARECNLDWIHSIVEQCSAAEIPVFVKQLGAKPFYLDTGTGAKTPFAITDPKGGNIQDFPCHFLREFPERVHYGPGF